MNQQPIIKRTVKRYTLSFDFYVSIGKGRNAYNILDRISMYEKAIWETWA
jgi:hypothetical protein